MDQSIFLIMTWIEAHQKYGHTMFVSFIELKIEGKWKPDRVPIQSGGFEIENPASILYALNEEDCIVHFIEPDGLRRILHFTKGGTIAIHQNILSYYPEQTEEITVDEKEQSGKGKTRDVL